jgi:hypothetical protein
MLKPRNKARAEMTPSHLRGTPFAPAMAVETIHPVASCAGAEGLALNAKIVLIKIG